MDSSSRFRELARRHFAVLESYVLQNPVKAKLVKACEEWPWSYFSDPLAKPDAN